MAKHSPGPWVVAKSGVSVDAGHNGPRIRQESTGLREVLEANARLIAAAPDLLAAAHVALVALSELVLTKVSVPSDRVAYDALEAAIEKAEGRS